MVIEFTNSSTLGFFLPGASLLPVSISISRRKKKKKRKKEIAAQLCVT
jgi:hypothetical protein